MSHSESDDALINGFHHPRFTSRPISKHPIIRTLTHIHAREISNESGTQHPENTWFGWGRKRSGQAAENKARQAAEPYWLLEDGFLRSVGREDSPLSLVFDNEGIYYDATQPSRLESLITSPLSEAETQRARALIQLWKEQKVSKYNQAPDYSEQLPANYVLVIDQVAGDSSIEYGMASADSFHQALNAALADNPDSLVLLKVHPDAFTRSKAGHFDLIGLQQNPRIHIINQACHPVRLLKHASHVYTVTSQMGFEALIWGKPVSCFGTPFYSGWGLTHDRGQQIERRQKRQVNLEQLVFAALIKYAVYKHPENSGISDIESVINWVALQRKMQSRFNDLSAPICAIGFSRWKKPFIHQFLHGSDIVFAPTQERCPATNIPAVWGSKSAPVTASKNVLRIEDGFLRSSGLGADLIRPLSWVIDDLGIYYDATRPSRLEKILSDAHWSEDELIRAERLRESIVNAGLSKYNLTGTPWKRPTNKHHQAQKVILVPGQVPTDASIQLGCQTINTNAGLLEAARKHNPNAYIVYKPHPDVIAGLRKKDSTHSDFTVLCDEIVMNVDGMQILEEVDEVHTLTSLMGFEALIRNKPVHCYGQPFYAGWGLTTDHSTNTRRKRILSIQQLCAGVLINYPTYVSRHSGCYTTPERVIQELKEWKNNGPSEMPLWRKGLRAVLRLFKR